MRLLFVSGMPGPSFPFAERLGSGMYGTVSAAERRTAMPSPTVRANSLHDFAQKARAIFKAPAIGSAASVRAQEFVTKVAVAMLDIDKIKADLPRQCGGAMELLDDGFDLTVGENGIRVWQFQSPIKQRMAVQDAWLGSVVSIGTAEATRVGELESDE
jgi:hypothetical protein